MNLYQVVCIARELERFCRCYDYSNSGARMHLHAEMTFRAQRQYAKSFECPKLFIDLTKPFCCHVGVIRRNAIKKDWLPSGLYLEVGCRWNRIWLREFTFRDESRWHMKFQLMLKVKPITIFIRHQSSEKFPTAEHLWKLFPVMHISHKFHRRTDLPSNLQHLFESGPLFQCTKIHFPAISPQADATVA